MKTRKTLPKNNKYYIRKVSGGLNGAVAGNPTIAGANVLANCVGYANGRFNESINDPELTGKVLAFHYQLVCNAENFIESAKNQGLKISKVPVQGGIMVWQKGATLGGGDGAGHVAFVEEVYEDGSILTSESGWGSRDWAFKNLRRTNTDGRWGQSSAYKFRGCIINPYIDGKPVPIPKLVIDGVGGPSTVCAMQKFFGTPEDGVISGQSKSQKSSYPALTSVSFGSGGSVCIVKLQEWCGADPDGYLGPKTVKKWQAKLGVATDGIFGKESMKAWQKYLNSQLFKDEKQEAQKTESKKGESASAKTDYLVIDVSEFQKAIDWQKVKAAGIKGAIVRCGYRGYEKGTLKEDAMYLNHIQGAAKAGLKVGIYFFTEAINAKEGKEEAAYAIKLLKKAGVAISYPIAIDTEAINAKNVRANDLSKAKRTEVIKAFCEEIKNQGYEPMIYASTSWLNNKLDMSKLPYKVWCAQYYKECQYKGNVVMWQYTSEGKVNGVSGVVDMNHCYIEGEEQAVAQSETTAKVTTTAAKAEPTHDEIIAKGIAWARKIAADNRYHYNLWEQGVAQSHKCPICSKLSYNKDPDHFGWNCIGFSIAPWHHGMGLSCTCNCHWISGPGGTGDKLLTVKTDAEALALAKKYTGLNDIKVIRNKNGIPKSKWKAGDICLEFKGEVFQHAFFYPGGKTVIDSTRIYTDKSKWTPAVIANQIKERSWDNYSAKVIVRWTGGNEPAIELPSTKLIKSNKEVKSDTIRFLKWIAGDNDFHYGHGEAAHHNGCYFCKTQPKVKKNAGIVDYEHTYCCNPLIGAGWAHGGCVPTALKLCKRGSSWDFGKDKGYDKSSLFTNLGHPDKSKLEAADVLCSDTHVALYIGGGKIVEASGGDDNVKGSKKWNNSIRITDLTDARYKKFKRVHRFNSSVDTTCCIYHGEVSKRVELLQAALKRLGYDIVVDGIFGDATLKAVEAFQKRAGVKADGIVGPNTIAALGKAVK